MKDNVNKIGAAFLIGGALGAVVALLYAPKSGRETRRDISRAARRVKNEAVDLIEETIEDISVMADDLREKAGDLVEQGIGLTDKTRKEIAKTLDHGQKAIEKQKKKLTEALGL